MTEIMDLSKTVPFSTFHRVLVTRRTAFPAYRLAAMLMMLLSACTGKEGYRDIRDYYFPLKQIQEGLVYEFQPVNNDSLGPVFWYFRSFLRGENKYLSSTYYEQDLIPLQQLKEAIVHNGILLEEMILLERDTLPGNRQTRIPVVVEAGNTFPFQVREGGGVFLYRIHWTSPADTTARYTLIKNRRFAGDTTIVFQGKTHPAVQFHLRELFAFDQNGVLETEYDSKEIYAKDIGLVYYRKDISEGVVLEYRLADCYPMAQLEARFRERYH